MRGLTAGLGGALVFLGFVLTCLGDTALLPLPSVVFVGMIAAGVGALVAAFWRDGRDIEIRRVR